MKEKAVKVSKQKLASLDSKDKEIPMETSQSLSDKTTEVKKKRKSSLKIKSGDSADVSCVEGEKIKKRKKK